MEDVVVEAGRPLFRLFYYLLRGLLWLAWDLSIEIIGWTIGWFVLRILSIGKFPQLKLSEQANATVWLALLVEFLGIGVLGLLTSILFGFAFQ